MSRSWKNYPFVSTGSSDKFQKRRSHKGVRHKSKEMLARDDHARFLMGCDLPVPGEIVDDYDYARSDGHDVSPKDGSSSHHHFTKHGKLRK